MKNVRENGLALARRFWEHSRPILTAKIPDLMQTACAGLAGEGSECFGCDDAISEDHDYGPGFCLWWPARTLAKDRIVIEEAMAELPAEFDGRPTRMRRNGRTGLMAIEDFYAFFTGLKKPPSTWNEWLNIPEEQLAAAVNGEIFMDGDGTFTHWRELLEDYYPHDVRLYKLASACMRMGQTGQYNLLRSLRRGEGTAAMLAGARFAEAALDFVYLINKRYKPFYKWAPRLARHLPRLGAETAHLLTVLAAHPLRDERDLGIAELIEDFCNKCAVFLNRQGLSTEQDSWLWSHGPAIMANVTNPEIRRLNLLKG